MKDARWGNALPGGGPWKIDDDCRGLTHNSLNSYRRRRGPARTQCTCPRTIALVDENNYERRMTIAARKKTASRASTDETGTILAKARLSQLERVHPPDLTAGLCQSAGGRSILDAALVQGKGWGERRTAAKVMCFSCSVRPACLRYIVAAEGDKPGSWSGYYAGFNPGERKKHAKERKRKTDVQRHTANQTAKGAARTSAAA